MKEKRQLIFQDYVTETYFDYYDEEYYEEETVDIMRIFKQPGKNGPIYATCSYREDDVEIFEDSAWGYTFSEDEIPEIQKQLPKLNIRKIWELNK